MEVKKEARKLGGITGNSISANVRKRKRIRKYELVSKWIKPADVLTWERRLI